MKRLLKNEAIIDFYFYFKGWFGTKKSFEKIDGMSSLWTYYQIRPQTEKNNA